MDDWSMVVDHHATGTLLAAIETALAAMELTPAAV